MDDFFQQWRTYRTVVQQGYMEHEGIAHCLSGSLPRCSRGLDILDLGCGDAEVFFRLLPLMTVRCYQGVDGSADALTILDERFEGRGVDYRLYCQDMLAFLQSAGDQFDVILAGYCIHHLSSDLKKQCLHLAAKHLRQQGALFIYDIFLQPGETRQQYLDNYLARVHSQWQAMSGADLTAVDAHIINCDFPEEVDTFRQWSEDVGFGHFACTWEGVWHSHKLLQLGQLLR